MPSLHSRAEGTAIRLKQVSWLAHPQPHTAFSEAAPPMTGFHPVCGLRAYSGGTARDLHPILYSPPVLSAAPAALEPVQFSTLILSAFSSAVNTNFPACHKNGHKKPPCKQGGNFLEVLTRFERVNQGFADPCLTTWPQHRNLERVTRLELATSTLARWRSTG